MTPPSTATARDGQRGRLLAGVRQRPAQINLADFPPGRVVPLPGRGRQAWVRTIEGPPGAPTVILLHGLLATADINWATSYRALSQSYTVVAVDQDGHGLATRSRRPFRLERCADDIASLCDVLEIDKPIVCGYSMGGPIALLTWRRHRGLVRGLVLCATVGRFNGHRRSERVGLLALTAGTSLATLVPQSIRRRAFKSVTSRVQPKDGSSWLLEAAANQDLVAGAQAISAILGFDSRPWIGEVDVPTAVVVMTQDQLLSPHRQRALARAIPGAVTVDCDADHATIVEEGTPLPAALLNALNAITTEIPKQA